MAIEVLMPVVTQEGDDGVVTAWFVGDGSAVTAGQLIAEVQAEKVAEEVHAPAAGVVSGLVAINQPVPQGAPICSLADDQEAPMPPTPASVPSAVAEEPAKTTPRIVASPSAKRLGRELGIDLATVVGTGPSGRITELDVKAAAATDRAAQPATELTGLRATIARNMRRSVRETAPVTLTTSVDVTPTVPNSITAWIVHTTAEVLVNHPHLNGHRDADRFVPAGHVNIAVAIQTSDGLVAPVVRDPQHSTVHGVAGEVARLAALSHDRQLEASDFAGGTFTVTNLGAHGIDAFTPIINFPQVAILGVGALRAVPRFDASGTVVARQVLTLSLTFDHAFVDGAPAAAFLADLRAALEKPD